MALAEPQTVTIDGKAIPLARVFTGTEVGNFVSGDGLSTITIDPRSSTRRKRNALILRQKKVTSDPLVSTTNVWKGITISLAVTRDVEGYSDADAKKALTGFLTWAQSAGIVDAFLQGQN